MAGSRLFVEYSVGEVELVERGSGERGEIINSTTWPRRAAAALEARNRECLLFSQLSGSIIFIFQTNVTKTKAFGECLF